MNNITEKELLQQIAEYEFFLVDLNLYLDTHSSDTGALNDYNSHSQQLTVLKDKYTRDYAPLENFGNALSLSGWQWNDTPWPWDL